MRWANFCAHRTRPRANFETNNTSAATDAGQYETTGTTARPQTATIETGNTTATEKCTKNSFFSPAKAMAVSIGARPARAKVTPVSTDPPHRPAKATPVSRERFPMPAGGGRARLRYPWAAARPGRATSGRPTLQTSSNQHDSHRLARTSVTNVVNLSPKTSIFTEKADGLTTFVTTGQKSTRKTPWIHDVCNNTHQTTPKHCNSNVANSMFEQVAGELRAKLMGDDRARPGFETTHRATSATRPHWCEGRRRDLPRCRWAAAGPGRTSRRCTEPCISDQAPLVWRAPEGPEGLAAVPVGGGGAWPGFEATRRAKLAARTARGRAAAHGHNQQPGPTAHHAAPGTPVGQQATPEICRGSKQRRRSVGATSNTKPPGPTRDRAAHASGR